MILPASQSQVGKFPNSFIKIAEMLVWCPTAEH